MTIKAPDIIIPTCRSAEEVSPLLSDLQGFSYDCRTFATCTKASAAKNRNICLEWATSDIVIMLDDDIAGFFDGWWKMMIKPLEEVKEIVMVSARLLKPDRSPGPMMFGGDRTIPLSEVPRVPTACIAFRNDGIRFDDGTLPDSLDEEGYVGSGFEDDDFCARIAERYPWGRVVINNGVQLVHFNDMKNQSGKFWERNKAYFDRVWNTEGTKRIRRAPIKVDQFFNIPKIIHFIWIGSELPRWAKANMEEFERLNPGFTIKLHGEEALNPIFKELWDRIDHPQHSLAIKSDLIKISVLMAEGGWLWDCDFWPLVSIEEICKNMGDAAGKTILFANEDRSIVANGVIGARANDAGLKYIVNTLRSFKGKHPEWWDYGTMITHIAVRVHGDSFALGDLIKVIPVVGKPAAMEIMKDQDNIKATAAAGAWAIHFEMQSTTDFI